MAVIILLVSCSVTLGDSPHGEGGTEQPPTEAATEKKPTDNSQSSPEGGALTVWLPHVEFFPYEPQQQYGLPYPEDGSAQYAKENIGIQWRLYYVALAQAFLFLVQSGVLIFILCANSRAARGAIIAAAAAQRSADATERGLTIAEQPYILVKDVIFSTLVSARHGSNPPSAKYTVRLYGKTPAMLRYASEEIVFDSAIPPAPEYKAGWRRIDFPQEHGDEWNYDTQYYGDAKDDELRGLTVRSKRNKYFLIACIVYDDVFQQQHRVGFCYQMGIGGGYGLIHGGARYNYHRVCKPEERM
jgi:hypothetical protein